MTWAEALMWIRRGEGEIQFTHQSREKVPVPNSNPSFPDMFSTFCHLVAHWYIDDENMGKGVSREEAFGINRICVLIPDLSLTG